MKERGQFPQSKEMGNIEVALSLAGDKARKTATLIFKPIQEYPLIKVGMAMTIGGLGGLIVDVAFLHQLDIGLRNIMLGTGLLGTGLYMAGVIKEILSFPDYGDG